MTVAISLNPALAEHGAEHEEQPVNVPEHPGTGAGTLPVPTGCAFLLSTGPCGERVRARGYCVRHYKQLARRNAFKIDQPAIGTTSTKSTIARNQRALDKARERLEAAAPDFVAHLIAASTIAAAKGKSGPAQWGLLHSRAVEPVEKAPQGAGSQGVKVFVGFSLGAGQPSALGHSTDHAALVEAQVIEQDQ